MPAHAGRVRIRQGVSRWDAGRRTSGPDVETPGRSETRRGFLLRCLGTFVGTCLLSRGATHWAEPEFGSSEALQTVGVTGRPENSGKTPRNVCLVLVINWTLWGETEPEVTKGNLWMGQSEPCFGSEPIRAERRFWGRTGPIGPSGTAQVLVTSSSSQRCFRFLISFIAWN